MEVNCRFIGANDHYQCVIDNTVITKKDQVIKEFKGIREDGKTNNDVKCVFIRETNVNYFPRGLGKHFPNLNELVIHSCGIKEISKNDLKGLKGLVDLWIVYCELTSLPDDLFTEMPNLREVSFEGNQIEFASSEVFKPLLGRENVKVNLQGNKSINAFFSPVWSRSLDSLEDFMKLIDEKCTKPAPANFVPEKFSPMIKEMWMSGRFSDLTISAGGKCFKVHKAILGMQSEVFAKIFEDQSEATEMKIPDFTSNSVEVLLKFIYTNEISEDGDAKENYEIADKFKVPKMKSVYEKIICDQLNDENALEVFMFAHRFLSQELKEKAYHQMVKGIPDDLPDLMEDPEELKKLMDARRVWEEALSTSKKLSLARK